MIKELIKDIPIFVTAVVCAVLLTFGCDKQYDIMPNTTVLVKSYKYRYHGFFKKEIDTIITISDLDPTDYKIIGAGPIDIEDTVFGEIVTYDYNHHLIKVNRIGKHQE